MDDTQPPVGPGVAPSEDMRPQGQPAAHPGPGHEVSDVSVRGIFLFAAGLGVLAVVLHVVFGAVMANFSARANRLELRRPGRFEDQSGQFPAPNLQESPFSDMRDLRDEEQAALAGYGWADRKAGIARIPINRAMNIVAARKGQMQRPTVAPDAAAKPAGAEAGTGDAAQPSGAEGAAAQPSGAEGAAAKPAGPQGAAAEKDQDTRKTEPESK